MSGMLGSCEDRHIVYETNEFVIWETVAVKYPNEDGTYIPPYYDAYVTKRKKMDDGKIYIEYYHMQSKALTAEELKNKNKEESASHTIEIDTIDALLIVQLLHDNYLKNETDKLIAERLKEKLIKKVGEEFKKL